MLALSGLVMAEDARVGVFVHAPNVYQDERTREAYGPSVEYIKAVLKEMGYTPVISVLPIARVFRWLESGEIDVTLEVGRSAERERFLFYPEEPAYVMKPALAFLVENKISKINSIDDVRGMTIGFLSGATSVGDFFSSDPTAVKFDLISGDTWLQQNLSKLLAGRIDAAMDQNPYSYLAEAKNRGVAGKIKVIELPGKGTDAYVVFSRKSPKGQAMVQAYNKAVAGGKYDLQIMIEDSLRTN